MLSFFLISVCLGLFHEAFSAVDAEAGFSAVLAWSIFFSFNLFHTWFRSGSISHTPCLVLGMRGIGFLSG